MKVFDVLEHHRAPLVLHQRGRRRGRLDDRPVGTEIAAQHRDAGVALEGLLEAVDHIGVPARRVLVVLPERLAVHRECIFVEKVILAKLADHRRQPARVVKILHQVLARRHQVRKRMHAAAEAVEVLHLEIDADPPRDRDEVDHRVGGAADRREHTDGILERLPGEDLRKDELVLHHFDDAPSRHAREHVPARIDRRDGGIAGHADAERLDHRCHGRSCSHGHAVAMRAVHARLGLVKLLQRDLSRPQVFGHRPHVGARADVVAVELAREHRSA